MLLVFNKTTITLTVLFLTLLMIPALAADHDTQNWSLINVHHNLDGPWSTSMQVENRIADEQDLWQEIYYTPDSTSRLSWTHQVRLEQRDKVEL